MGKYLKINQCEDTVDHQWICCDWRHTWYMSGLV